jgi:hypothetical protein
MGGLTRVPSNFQKKGPDFGNHLKLMYDFQKKGHYPGSYVQIMSTSRKGAVFLDINYQLSRFLGSLPKTKKPSLVHKDD